MRRVGISKILNLYLISFSSREWMVVSVFDDDARFSIHLCELARDETDDPVFEVRCIIEEDWERSVDILKGFLKLSFSVTLARLIQVFEFREEAVSILCAREEPAECSEWSIHATSRIDARPDLESYDICIALSDFLSSLQELAQSTRARVLHLGESECGDHAILSDDWHTVRDRSERGEVDVASEDFRYIFTSYSYKYSV
jgi:hypothetical protein